MKHLVSLFFVFFLLVHSSCGAMSEAQVKAAVKMVRNVCQPKNKAPTGEIDAMHQGKWEDLSHATKCYLACALSMNKMITKDGKFNYDQALIQLKQLPDTLKATSEATIEECKDSVKSEDKCEAAYDICRCFYESNPEKYFLP